MAARSLADCVGSIVGGRSRGCRGDAARRGVGMRLGRRSFARLVGMGAVVWAHAGCAQGRFPGPREPNPATKRPIIGYLSGWSAEEARPLVAAFHAGLKEAGYVEAMNVLVESRFADGQVD